MNVTILNQSDIRRTIAVNVSVGIGTGIVSVKIDTPWNEIAMWIECPADPSPKWTPVIKYPRYAQEV